MSNIEHRGSAAVEMVYALLFLLAFVAVVQRFSLLAGSAHRLSTKLQNDVEDMMIKAGRPPCLFEEFDPHSISGESARALFNRKIAKELVFVTQPICSRE